MKPTMTIFVCVLAGGLAAAQSPNNIIQSTRTTMNGVRDNSAAASNAALGIQDEAPRASSATHSPAQPDGTVAVSKTPFSATKKGARKPSAGKTSRVKPVQVVFEKKSGALKIAPAHSKIGAIQATAVAGNGTSESGDDNAGGTDLASSDSKGSARGRRDPFVSPVVSHVGNAVCSAGKKCLEIGTISLRGIVHAESGFIAVVSNSMNKAYFLRENDPVFNGYVMKITGDSIVFQETVQDRLGKTFKREVVKKITTPAV